jgi:tetratricopeptide (TPR) repeat protein
MDEAGVPSELSFRLLGPFEIRRSGVPIEMSSKSIARRVLMLLLLECRFITVEELLERLWTDNPPLMSTLQEYVSDLRKDLRPDGHLLEYRRGSGYRIEVDRDTVDLFRFARLLKDGRALADREPRRALELLREALELWTGDPPVDLLTNWDPRADRRAAQELVDRLEAEAGNAPGQSRRSVPQLDEPPPNFAGRTRELAELDRHVDPAGPDGATRVIVIDGQAGVGKTALALQWGARVVANYPDGQISLNLRGFDPTGTPLKPETVARRLLVKLGVDERGLPPDPEDLLDRYRAELAGRSVLLVLDNAASLEQVKALVLVSSTSLAVVTSRRRLDGLAVLRGARFVPVERPDADEAADMLRGHLGGVELNASVADTVVAACGRLPLALAIAGARIRRSGRDIDSTVRSLAELEWFDTGDETTSLPVVLGWSYARLSPISQNFFRALNRHPGPELTTGAVAAAASRQVPEAERALAELSEMRLLEEAAAGRYTFLDLIRKLAIDLARDDDAEERIAGVGRVFDHYLHTADRCATRMRPHRQPLTLDPPVDGALPITVASEAAAIAWFDVELPVLRRLVLRCAELGQPKHGWQLLTTMIDYLDWRGHWSDWIELSEAALRACEEINDEAGMPRCLRSLGRALVQVGRFEEAEERLRAALARYQAMGDVDGQVRLHHDLGYLFDQQGRIEAALGEAVRACDLADAEGITQEKANALGGMAWCLVRLKRYSEAVPCCEQAIALHRAAGFPHGEAAARHTLGLAQEKLGDHDEALLSLEESAGLCQRAGDRPNEAMILEEVAVLRAARGDNAGAESARARAAHIRRELAA